jgi:hypothetical protein
MSEKNYQYRMHNVVTEEVWDCTNLGTLVRIMNSNSDTCTKIVKVKMQMETFNKFSQYPFYIVYNMVEYTPIATPKGIGYNYYHTQAEMAKAKIEGLTRLFNAPDTPVYMLDVINNEIDGCESQWRHYTADADDVKSFEEDDDDEK